jgi:hypothetical protein
MPFFRFHLLALLSLAPALAAQESVVPAAPRQQPLFEGVEGFVGADDPAAASALLQEIAAAQFATGKRSLVDGIYLELYLKERQEGAAREIGFTLLYQLSPREIIELSVDDPERGTAVKKGFDGRDYWLREGDAEKQQLSGHEFGKDRESIDEAMDLCSDLMLMLDFRQLEERNLPHAVLAHEDGRRILSGAIRRHDGAKWEYRLWLASGSLQPHRLELARQVEVPEQQEPADAEPDTDVEENAAVTEETEAPTEVVYQRFELAYYEAFAERHIPRLIEVFDAPFVSPADLPVRILQIHDFRWMSAGAD